MKSIYPVVDGKKQCSRCKKIKDVSEFNKSSRIKCGYYPACKDCRKKERENNAMHYKEYREKNKEHRAEVWSNWHKKNRKTWIEYKKKYNEGHKEENRAYRELNKEKIKLQSNKRYKKNPLLFNAVNYFGKQGLKKNDLTPELIDAKIKHIELIRAIKSQKDVVK